MQSKTAQPKNWIDNTVANQVVAAAQQAYLHQEKSGKAIQDLMDAIANVYPYKLGNPNRQGMIGKIIHDELAYVQDRKYQSTMNFGMDDNDIISTYWGGVLGKLLDAKQHGEDVDVRVVVGQDLNGQTTFVKAGATYIKRKTKDNPINWLRNHGKMAVRNEINKLYRDNLTLVCDACGHSSTVKPTEVNVDCKCGSIDTKITWPSGHSSYGAEKARMCNTCGNTWTRRFEKVCHKCLSPNVRTECKYQQRDEDLGDMTPSEDDTPEMAVLKQEVGREYETIKSWLMNALPKDPQNPSKITMKQKIFMIMSDPAHGSDICIQCKAASPKICSVRCDQFKAMNDCGHEKMFNPKDCCGADTFSTETCVNYSKKLGAYCNVSSSLQHRHVRDMRETFINQISNSQHKDICVSIKSNLQRAGVMPKNTNEKY